MPSPPGSKQHREQRFAQGTSGNVLSPAGWRRLSGAVGSLLLAALLLFAGGRCSSDVACTSDTDCSGGQRCVNQVCTAAGSETTISKEQTSSEVASEVSTEPTSEPAGEFPSRDTSPERTAEKRPEPPASEPGVEPVVDASVPESREPSKETSPQESPPETPAGPRLNIYIAGETKAITFQDGLAGQTPRAFFMGIQKFEILKSRNDPSPAVVFDLGASFVKAPMDQRNLVGSGALSTIPDGTYPYGRTTVVFMTFEVSATAHLNNFALPGTLGIYYALGDHKSAQGENFVIGDVAGAFQAAGQSFPYRNKVPVNFTLSDPDTWVDTSTGKTLFHFKIGKAIVKNAATRPIDVTLHFNIFEAFRWNDETRTNFKTGVYDITTSPTTSEQVLRYGANSYRITQP